MTDNTHNNTPVGAADDPVARRRQRLRDAAGGERTPERRREREWRELETDKAALEQATPFRE